MMSRVAISFLGWIWVAILLVVLVATFFPALGRRQQRIHGERCSQNLESIYEAKAKLAAKWDPDPSDPEFERRVSEFKLDELIPFLREGEIDLECPAGGEYQVFPLLDMNGEVVPPICTKEWEDPDGDGATNTGEGLHIHLRSHLQDPNTGVYYRDPSFVFPRL